MLLPSEENAQTATGFWTLDPIDGTKGFLRGGQYAVCLALIVDSVVQLGVMGCPNLSLSSTDPDGERGAVFIAIRGQGAEQVNYDRLHTYYIYNFARVISLNLIQVHSGP